MIRVTPFAILLAWCCLGFPRFHKYPQVKSDFALAKPSANDGLFEQDSILSIRLSGNIKALLNDRQNLAKYYPIVLSYNKQDGSPVLINLKAKTRGNFRRRTSICSFPPILLNFQKSLAQPSIFEKQDKLKLVLPCQGENLIAREYLVYKLYNLLTLKSYKARLVRVSFDGLSRKKDNPVLGILLEEDEQMAKRNESVLINQKKMKGEGIELESYLTMAVFQYMIGNTDWSVEYFHNTRMIAYDSISIPFVVPYDFDHAGIVGADYAKPAEELALSSTMERRFRGFCLQDFHQLDKVIDHFNRLKKEFLQVYLDCPYLDSKYLASTIKYLEQFYAVINNPQKLKSEFGYPCQPGVPNVVIKGMGGERKE